MQSFFPQWIQDINTGLSLVGFLITVYVLIEVRSIKKSFLSKARLPELISDLEKSGSIISKNLNNWPEQQHHFVHQVKISISLLNTTVEFTPTAQKVKIKNTVKKLSNSIDNTEKQKNITTEIAWDLYSDIQSSISQLTQILKNNQWE